MRLTKKITYYVEDVYCTVVVSEVLVVLEASGRLDESTIAGIGELWGFFFQDNNPRKYIYKIY